MPLSNDTSEDRLHLQRRISELEAENARLRQQADDVAEANVRAAMQLIDVHADRERSLQIKNREIEAALQKAEEASRQKSRFLANMSHELRTPLSGIRGMAELLRDGPLPPVQRDYVDAIARTADDFLQLVNELLDFAKIEAGRLELERIEFDLWELVEDCVQHLQVAADSKGLPLGFELGAEVPRRIVGDPLRLRQVLLNLGSNAVKFTTRGHVRVVVRRVVGASSQLECAIEDTGCGISEEVAAKLFEPFVQADASTTRRYGGTGLGLVIGRYLAERMGGKLEFTSRVGVGTTFTLRLPLPAEQAAAESAVAPTGRAVVVGRDAATASMLRSHLEAAGWSVDLRQDLDAAATAADLLVVDCAADGGEERQWLQAQAGSLPGVLLLVHGGAAVALADTKSQLQLERPLRPTRLLAALRRLQGEREIVGTAVPMASELAGMRVLVAEDTPVNRRVVIAQLERLGVKVTSVEDGVAAVAAAREGHFDLVLMDCHMPQLDGYEATAAIRRMELGHGRHTPIVALTASIVPGHKEQCLAAGMDDHLVKPVRREDLEGVLRRYRRC